MHDYLKKIKEGKKVKGVFVSNKMYSSRSTNYAEENDDSPHSDEESQQEHEHNAFLSTRFRDQVVFITGGTSGIGLVTAVQFAKQGAKNVIVCGRTPYKWDIAQKYISKQELSDAQTNSLEYYPCDVRVEEDVRSLLSHIYDKYKRLDICINNAGVQPVWDGDITKINFHSYREDDGSIVFRLPPPGKCEYSQTTPVSQFCESPIATSAFGVMFCLKWEIYYAQKQQPNGISLSIVNTASRMGILPDAHRPDYASAKAFIIQMTRSVSSQVASNSRRFPIRINCIAPGPVDTPLERAAFPGNTWKRASVGVPMARSARPEEIAPVILFLSDSQMASYITGSVYTVDGGFTAAPQFM